MQQEEYPSLMNMAPEEVAEGLEYGAISEEDAEKYLVLKSAEQKGFYNLEPEKVEAGFRLGIYSEEQARKYLEKHQEPQEKSYIKDVFSGFGRGTKYGLQEMWDTSISTIKTFNKTISKTFGRATLGFPGVGALYALGKGIDELEDRGVDLELYDPEQAEIPETLPGAFAQGMGQFLPAFVPMFGQANKAMKATQLAQRSPKFASFIAATVAGAGADLTVFDPHEARLSNLLIEHPKLQVPILEWLAASPDDGEWEGKMKNAIEGAGLGLFTEVAFLGLRSLKTRLWVKNRNIPDKVAEDVSKAIPEGQTLEAPKKTAPASPEEMVATPQTFSEQVQHNIQDLPEWRDSGQVYISDAYDAAVQKGYKGTADDFKKELFEAQKRGELDLRAADLVEDMDRGKLSASKYEYLGSEWHFIKKKPLPKKKPTEAPPVRDTVDESGIEENAPHALDYVEEDLGMSQYHFRKSEVPTQSTKRMRELADYTIKQMQDTGKLNARVSDEVFNVLKYEGPEVHHEFISMMAEQMPKTTKVSHKAVDKLARLVGGRKSSIEKALTATADAVDDLNVKVKAAHDYLRSYDEFILRMAKKADQHTDADVLTIAAHMMEYDKIQRLVKRVQVGTARGLDAHRIDRKARGRFSFEDLAEGQIDDLINTAGGRDRLKKVIKTYTSFDNANQRANFVRNYSRNPLSWLITLRQSALVSGWPTQVVNMVGSSLATGFELTAKTMSMSAMGLKDPQRFKQIGRMYAGLGLGLRDAFYIPGFTMLARGEFRAFKEGLTRDWITERKIGTVYQTLIEGEPVTDFITKYDTSGAARAFDIPNLRLPASVEKSLRAKVKWLDDHPWLMQFPMGGLIRLPFRALAAGDELFKSMNYSSDIHVRAWDHAYDSLRSSGKSYDRKLFHQIYDEAVSNPPDTMKQAAIGSARDSTFTNPLRGIAAKGGHMMSYDPTKRGITNVFSTLIKAELVPFYNVLVNIALYSMRRTPLAALGIPYRKNGQWKYAAMSQHFIDAFNKGGRERGDALARVALGSGVMGLGFYLAETNKIIGHVPKEHRDAFRNAQIQPYSWVTDKGTTSFNRFDPFASFFGYAADLTYLYRCYQMTDKEFYELMAIPVTGLAHTIGEKTWARSLKDMMDLLFDPSEHKYRRFAHSQLATHMPFAIALQNHQVSSDEFLRDMHTPLDALWKNIDTGKLPPRLHRITGEPIPVIDRLLGMANRTEWDHEDRAIVDMGWRGIGVQKMTPKLSLGGGITMDLDIAQEHELQSYMGTLPMRESLNKMYDAFEERGVQDDQIRAEGYKNIVNEYRKIAREMYLKEHRGEAREHLEEEVRKRRDAMIEGTRHMAEGTQPYGNFLKRYIPKE